jgi:hypothetical protein
MNNILNNIIDDPYDITYFSIGSANIRNTNEDKDRQQFPPFLESIYKKTKKKIRIINIDNKFEKPYYLTSYLQNIICHNNNIIGERLDIYYLEEEFKFNNSDNLELLNIINTTIMDQNKLLIFNDYTGRGLFDLEKYFFDIYSKTEYKKKYNDLICYGFNYDNENTCTTDLTVNFPIIKNDKLIKITNNEDLKKNISENKEYVKLFQKYIIKELKNFININLYIYRNLINKNITNNVLNDINNSIFNELKIENYENDLITSQLISKILEYYDIFVLLFNANITNELSDLINSINHVDIYTVYNNFNKFLVKLKDITNNYKLNIH